MNEPATLQEALAALRTEHKRIVAQISRDHELVREIANSAWKSQEAERRRLARELHDGVGQTLGAMKNELIQLLQAELPQAARNSAERTLALCSESIADIRQVSRLLFPPALADLGLQAALEQLVRGFEEQQVLKVELSTRGELQSLSLDEATFVYRICQEALSNASKYAPGSSAVVAVRLSESQCVVRVMDDGPGFDTESMVGRGFGLQSMRERASLLGARIAIESTAGEGTRIEARFTIEKPDSAGDRDDP